MQGLQNRWGDLVSSVDDPFILEIFYLRLDIRHGKVRKEVMASVISYDHENNGKIVFSQRELLQRAFIELLIKRLSILQNTFKRNAAVIMEHIKTKGVFSLDYSLKIFLSNLQRKRITSSQTVISYWGNNVIEVFSVLFYLKHFIVIMVRIDYVFSDN